MLAVLHSACRILSKPGAVLVDAAAAPALLLLLRSCCRQLADSCCKDTVGPAHNALLLLLPLPGTSAAVGSVLAACCGC